MTSSEQEAGDLVRQRNYTGCMRCPGHGTKVQYPAQIDFDTLVIRAAASTREPVACIS